jgi:hypothetical protein
LIYFEISKGNLNRKTRATKRVRNKKGITENVQTEMRKKYRCNGEQKQTATDAMTVE